MRRIRHGHLALPVFTILVTAVSGAESVSFERRENVGDRLVVREAQITETRIHVKKRGAFALGAEEVDRRERSYTQEVLHVRPRLIRRAYEYSRRTKGRRKDNTLKPMRTSLNGRTIDIPESGAPRCEGFVLSKDDRDNLYMEKLVYAALPKQPLARGGKWRVDADAFGRAIFGKGYSPANMKTGGRGVFRGYRTTNGDRAAELSLSISLEMAEIGPGPGFGVALEGKVLFSVARGKILRFRLSGPVHWQKSGHGGGAARADGTMTLEYIATPEGARPPEKSAKMKPIGDDERRALARKAKAAVLVCPSGHRYPAREYRFCPVCGSRLGKDRTCPRGCPWSYGFCPLDGGELKPEKR